MNEILNDFRFDAGISRLVDDPRLLVVDVNGNVTDPLKGLQIFAELIVEECANWIDANVGMITPEARADLLKHFRDE